MTRGVSGIEPGSEGISAAGMEKGGRIGPWISPDSGRGEIRVGLEEQAPSMGRLNTVDDEILGNYCDRGCS